jgi:flagellar hook-associated protein 2
VQWNDVVDSLITAEEARLVTPITDAPRQAHGRARAWTTFRTMVDKLNDAARAVRVAGFGGYLATAPKSPLSGQTLFGASASTLAEPGRYRVEVLQLAETARLGGKAVADRSAALNLTVTFAINGTSIAIDAGGFVAGDSRQDQHGQRRPHAHGRVREHHQRWCHGRTAGAHAHHAGRHGITLTDGTGGLARELGFIDSRTKPVSSTTDTIAAALGIAVYPPPASIRVGDRVITVDLSTDSIASIVAKINAAGGQASAAEEPSAMRRATA